MAWTPQERKMPTHKCERCGALWHRGYHPIDACDLWTLIVAGQSSDQCCVNQANIDNGLRNLSPEQTR